jgi:hypothetical protein
VYGQEEALHQKWAQILKSIESLRNAALFIGPEDSATRRIALLIRRALTKVPDGGDHCGAGKIIDPIRVTEFS